MEVEQTQHCLERIDREVPTMQYSKVNTAAECGRKLYALQNRLVISLLKFDDRKNKCGERKDESS